MELKLLLYLKFLLLLETNRTDFSYIQSLEGDLVKLLSETSKKNCIYLDWEDLRPN